MKTLKTLFVIVIGLFLGLGLVSFTGCGEDTGEGAEETMEETGEAIKEGAEDAGDAVKEGAEDVGDAVEDSVD